MRDTQRLRVLAVSHLFRNPLEHSKLPHLADLFQAMSEKVDIEVIAPVPWYPPLGLPERWHRFSQIPRAYTYGDIRVRYPRHFILPSRMLYFLAGRSFLRTLRRATAGESYDVIWAHYAYPDGWAAVRLGEERGTPVMVTVRGEDVRSDVEHLGVRKRVAWTLQMADVVTSPHPETTKLTRGLGREHVVSLNNALNVERFAGGQGQRIRDELGLGEEFVVTFIAHLVAFKDPQTLIEAAALGSPEDRSVFLMVGSAGRGREPINLKRLAADRGLGDRLRFLGDRRDIPDILAASDLFVTLSPYENIWSNTLLEAMAARIPCIVTRVGLTDQYLRHGETAWLIPARSPYELREAIDHLRSHPEIREQLTRQAFSIVASQFDLQGVTKQAIDLVRTLVEGRGS